jgi:hypothetical protein
MSVRYSITVHNVPYDHKEYKYMVAKLYDGELWFYGEFNDYIRATRACTEIKGVILEWTDR